MATKHCLSCGVFTSGKIRPTYAPLLHQVWFCCATFWKPTHSLSLHLLLSAVTPSVLFMKSNTSYYPTNPHVWGFVIVQSMATIKYTPQLSQFSCVGTEGYSGGADPCLEIIRARLKNYQDGCRAKSSESEDALYTGIIFRQKYNSVVGVFPDSTQSSSHNNSDDHRENLTVVVRTSQNITTTTCY